MHARRLTRSRRQLRANFDFAGPRNSFLWAAIVWTLFSVLCANPAQASKAQYSENPASGRPEGGDASSADLFVALDITSTSALWARCHFYEIQAGIIQELLPPHEDLNRKHLQRIQDEIIATLTSQFPDLKPDLEPKYCKALAALEQQIPGYRFLIRFGLDNADGVFLIAAAVIGMLISSFVHIHKYWRPPRIKCSVQPILSG